MSTLKQIAATGDVSGKLMAFMLGDVNRTLLKTNILNSQTSFPAFLID